MPYSSIGDLPSSVKGTAKQKRQYMHVFNSVYERCQKSGGKNCDAVAARQANGVVFKSKGYEESPNQNPNQLGESQVQGTDMPKGFEGELPERKPMVLNIPLDMIEVDRDQDGRPIMAHISEIGLQPKAPVQPASAADIAAIARASGLPTNQIPLGVEAPPKPVPPPNQQPSAPSITSEPTTAGFVERTVEVASNADAPYIGGYEVEQHQISQEAAGYKPFGATDGRGCASCAWFVSPNGCILVRGDISPTGLSQLYRQDEPEEVRGMPVEVVKVAPSVTWGSSERIEPSPPNDNLVTKIINMAKGIANPKVDVASIPEFDNPFTLYKVKGIDSEGAVVEQLRFVAFWSNRYFDNSGEAIPLSAHEENVKWIDENQAYPVLINWHAIGTEYGQVDCVDLSDGFNVAFGYILPGKEEIAYRVASSKEPIGMSHGSVYRTDRMTGDILQFRTFEISTLPASRAKNSWTSWNLSLWAKEADSNMAFSQEKVAHLKSLGYTNEQIQESQNKTAKFKADLAEIGIEFKGDDPPDTGALIDVIGALVEQNQTLKTDVDGLKAQIPELVSKVEAANADLDTRVAAALQAPGSKTVFKASEDDSTVVPNPVSQAAPVPAGAQGNQSGWGENPAQKFMQTVWGNAIPKSSNGNSN